MICDCNTQLETTTTQITSKTKNIPPSRHRYRNLTTFVKKKNEKHFFKLKKKDFVSKRRYRLITKWREREKEKKQDFSSFQLERFKTSFCLSFSHRNREHKKPARKHNKWQKIITTTTTKNKKLTYIKKKTKIASTTPTLTIISSFYLNPK